jgi:anti-sigma B factor antagonist
MDLSFREHTVDGAAVLELRGQADLSTLPLLHERVNRFAAEHQGRHAIIDLTGVGALEPVTLGVLIGARLLLRAGGGELDLVCAEPDIVALFARSGLDAVFALHPTVAAAVGGR